MSFERARRWIGRGFDAQVDSNEGDRGSVARHSGQAPEVDAVSIIADRDYPAGEFVSVKCVDTDDYDLVVKPVKRKLNVLAKSH